MTETEPASDSRSRGDATRRLLGLGIRLVAILVVIPFAVHAFPQVVGADASYVVLSGSMEPTIQTGDAILVEEIDPGTLVVGEIITYGRPGMEVPTTHRIVDIVVVDDGFAFRTKGDNNEETDLGLVGPGQIIGRIPVVDVPYLGPRLAVIPKIGYVIQLINTPYGFALLVGGPFALLVVTEAWGAIRRRSPERSTHDGGPGASGRGGPSHPADLPDAPADRWPEAPADRTSEGSAESVDRSGVETASDDDGSGLITLSGRDLHLSLAALGVFAIYAAGVAYVTLEPWAVAIAVAAGGTAGFLAVIKYAGIAGGEPVPDDRSGLRVPGDGDDGGGIGRVLDGTLDETTVGMPTVRLADLDTLASLARSTGAWLIRDGSDAHYVIDDGIVYTHDRDPVNPALPPGRPETSVGDLVAADGGSRDDDGEDDAATTSVASSNRESTRESEGGDDPSSSGR